MIDLAPGAEEHPLGLRFAERIRENVLRVPSRARAFRALRGAVQIVPFETGEALTLRFDHGRCTFHDGSVGIPLITIGGPLELLSKLEEVDLQGFRLSKRAPRLLSPALRDLVGRWGKGELEIYGLMSHPRTVLRVLRLLAMPP